MGISCCHTERREVWSAWALCCTKGAKGGKELVPFAVFRLEWAGRRQQSADERQAMTDEWGAETRLGSEERKPMVGAPDRARLAIDRKRFTVLRLGEHFYNAFWLLPVLFLIGALLLAVITHAIDKALPANIGRTAPWVVSAGSASVVLATLATAMLTFLGVVFSIGLVALQLASQQFSPRVLRNYVRSTTTKVALGTFIATFIYPLFSLGYLDELMRGGRDVSTISVAVAMILALASIAVFIAYVTLTIRGMRIAYAISTVAVETRKALAQMFPPDERYVTAETLAASPPARLVYLRKGPWSLAEHAPQGVLQAVDVVGCVRRAREHDVVLRLVPQVGDYVSEGEPLFEVYAGGVSVTGGPTDWQLLRAVDVGRERAVYQDPFYGIRALVDVAAQALSPAVNAPTTAVQVLDRLEDFLRLMASRPWPSGLFADETGAVRLVMEVRSWDQFVDLALTEITEFGAGSPQVTRRLANLLDALMPIVPDERKPVLVRHKRLLEEAVAQRFASYRALATVALQPDARGLG
jgi:uncharacterized membrane protein